MEVAMMKYITMLFVLLSACTSAFANITLSKNRLFFAENERADAVQLRNSGGRPMQFNTKLHLVEMDENGGIVRVDEMENSAISMLKFSPKRGIVEPGGKQVIRFSVRRPRDLNVGEYRAVLSITTSIATDKPEAVTLNSRLAYNMPVIIRHGSTEAATQLVNSRIVYFNNSPQLELWQTLEGNRSLYGNFTVTNKQGEQVGLLNGVAVYTPLNQRKVLIPLNDVNIDDELFVNYQEVIAFGGDATAQALVKL